MEEDYINDIIRGYEKDLQSVKEDGYGALNFVIEQTPELCLAAVKENAWNLEYVKEQTYALCFEAIKQDGSILRIVKEQTYELCYPVQ